MESYVRLALLFFAKDAEPLMAWPTYDFKPLSKIKELEVECGRWAKELNDRVKFLIRLWIKSEEDLRYVKELSKDLDGLVIYVLTTGLNYSLFFRTVYELSKPTLILTEPYYSLIWPRVSKLMREDLPVVGISSSSREDFIKGLKALYTYIMLKKKVKVVVVSTPDEMSLEELHKVGIYVGDRGPTREYYERIKEFLDLEFVDYRYFLKLVDEVADEEAVSIAEELRRGAYAVRDGVDIHDLIKAVKMYLAARKLVIERGAGALAINCFAILLKDINAMPVTPCVAVTLLNDEGIPAACEADLNSLIIQLVFKYLANRPAWITDPIIDFNGNYLIHAHCTAPTRMRGFNYPPEPYALDTHDESGKPVVVRTKMSRGEAVTVAQISSDFSKLLVHRGVVEDAPVVDLACRTKVKFKVKDVRKLLWSYEMPLHRVLAYGDWLDELEMLSRYLGLKFYVEVE